MITAHLPSGYVLSHMAGWQKSVAVAAIVGAGFPDIDLLWYFYVDNTSIHHHRYWVHAPAFALGAGALLVLALHPFAPRLRAVGIAFAAGWFLHICLDGLVGEIMWLWPINDTLYAMIDQPPSGGQLVSARLLQWSFFLELPIWASAIYFFFSKGRRVVE